MNNFVYENYGTSTYLVYQLGDGEVLDTMSLGMLTNNKIAGLASTQFIQMDTAKYIRYNVTSHISVKQFFYGSVNKRRLIGVFKGIANAVLSADDYMINPDSILIDVEYIFADVSNFDTVLICLPVQCSTHKNPDLGAFFKNIMFNTQFDQTENCDYVAKIMNYLNSTPVFSISEFKSLLTQIEKDNNVGNVSAVARQPETAQKQEPPKQQQTVQPVVQPPQVQVPPVTNIQNTNTMPVTKKYTSPANVAPKPMNIPQANAVQSTQTVQSDASQGEKISFFYLMQHYNKENAAAYKAQKAANKKQAPKNTVVAQQKPVATQSTPPSFGFAVPGQATPVSAVPPAQPVKQKQPVAAVSKPVNQITPPTPAPASAPIPVNIPSPSVLQGQSMNYGETTVLGVSNMGETTVLGAASVQTSENPYLIRIKNNEKIMVNKPIFRIGKERSYVDYFIGDNTAVSRSHANVISRDGEYFVMDTNSTNHTYLNGVMLQSNVETKIKHSDKIRIANEEFEFKLY